VLTGELDAIVFDWGGVLSSSPRSASLRRLEHRLGLGRGELAGLFGSARFFTDEEWMEACAGRVAERDFWAMVLGRMPAAVGEDLLAQFMGDVVWTPARAEMVELMRTLRCRVPLALLSNNTPGLRRLVEPLGLFDVVALSAELGICKPEAPAFEHVLRQLDLPAARVLMVDDGPWNVTAARALGMRAHRYRGTGAFRRYLGA
jgi:HAD superfamily hydrolase (TIGR01509 family)